MNEKNVLDKKYYNEKHENNINRFYNIDMIEVCAFCRLNACFLH